jgi:hypothetical protein
MSGLRRLALTPCSGEPRTALRVTSLPRAGRGGHRDERQRRGGDCATFADDLEEVERLAAVGGKGGDCFAGINRAAPADGNYHVTARFPRAANTLADQVDRGFAGDGKEFR